MNLGFGVSVSIQDSMKKSHLLLKDERVSGRLTENGRFGDKCFAAE